jgi:hypothetical protein
MSFFNFFTAALDPYSRAIITRLTDLIEILIDLESKRIRRIPVRITLALPVVILKDGTPMANYELLDDTVAYIAINTVDAGGDVVPAPSGDVFSAAISDATSLTATIGVMPSGPLAGAVALVLTPLKLAVSGLTVTVSDSAALTNVVLTVDIVTDLTPKSITLDTTDAVLVPQAAPTS